MKAQEKLQLTDETVRQQANEALQKHFGLMANGYACTTEMVVDVLLMAAASGQSIESVCKNLKETVDGETIRSYLNQQINSRGIEVMERNANRALVASIPKRLSRQKVAVAIDLHDEPFYGNSAELVKWACRGEAHKGTTRFYRIATAYVIFRGARVTLAMLFVLPTDSLSEVVASLVRRLSILGLKVKCLCLDKGFCAIQTLRNLQSLALPTLVACPIRGKKGGTRRLCHGRSSYLTQHTFKNQQTGSYTASLAIVRTFTTHKRSKRQQRRATWLVFVVLNSSLSAAKVLALYRKRFGIESSYRCLRQARIYTTSRNPALRFFLLALAVLLVNLWMILRWLSCQRALKPGPHSLDVDRFQFNRFRSFLIHAIERIYGFISFISIDLQPILS